MVTITVNDVDEAPEIMEGGLAISGLSSIDYAENGTGMVAMYTASGPDAASATWSAVGIRRRETSPSVVTAGVLSFMNSPDYENPVDADMRTTCTW